MGKQTRGKKLKSANGKSEDLNSDDEDAYGKSPDKRDDSFYRDEIDAFHAEQDKILIERGVKKDETDQSSDEEEVLGLQSGSDEDEIAEYERRLKQFQSQGFHDDLASDLEEDRDDLPDDQAWGLDRKKFYGADVEDNEHIEFSGSEPDTAELEEQMARDLQRKLAQQLDDQDFSLDMFKTVDKAGKKKATSSEQHQQEKIEQDLSQLTKREKLQLLKKESPELLQLIDDFKVKMTELKDVFLPIQSLIRNGKLPKSKGADYIETKTALYLNYCTNISFYMMLKAKRTPVEHHPVIKRLLQFRNLITQMETVDAKIASELKMITEKIKSGENILMEDSHGKDETSERNLSKNKTKKRPEKSDKKLSSLLSDDSDEESTDRLLAKKRKKAERAEGRYETKGEKAALQYYEMMKAGRLSNNDVEDDDEEASPEEEEAELELGARMEDVEMDEENEEEEEDYTEDGKRAITYQIAKNKGLAPKRKKEQRNPRVKHRLKYRKAKIRRKGQVREVRTELHKYGGEISGIRAGIKRSIKLT